MHASLHEALPPPAKQFHTAEKHVRWSAHACDAWTAAGVLRPPDELLRNIPALSWAAWPEWSAAEEVHHAVELHSVCRALRASLRAQSLALVLDFYDAPLTPRQRA